VISKASNKFWKCYAGLPAGIKKQARQAFQRFSKDPYHPGLRFKRVHSTRPIFSVRISRDYRAIGLTAQDEIVWFWIGSHMAYDRMVRFMRKS
jgi:hypothetical protein